MTVFPDQAAADYDQRILRLVPGYELALDLAAGYLAASCGQAVDILAPGCGTGGDVLALAGRMPQAHFLAFDPSRGMMEKARERFGAAGVLSRVDLRCCTMDAIDKTRHDAALVSLVLHFLADDGDKANFLRAVHDRVQPNAPLLLFDAVLEPGDDNLLAAWLRGQGHAVAAVEAILNRIDKDWRRITSARRDELLVEAGFEKARRIMRVPGFDLVATSRVGGRSPHSSPHWP